MQRECPGRVSDGQSHYNTLDLRELGTLGHWGECDIITWLSAFPSHWHKSKAETGRSAPRKEVVRVGDKRKSRDELNCKTVEMVKEEKRRGPRRI